MSTKILITDPLSDKGIEFLKESGLEVIYKPKASKDEIQVHISNIEGWIIRSGTKISKENKQVELLDEKIPEKSQIHINYSLPLKI